MAAFIIGFPRELPSDPAVLRPYVEQVEATLAPYGGRYRVLFPHRVEVLEGDWAPPLGRLVLIEYPSLEQARAHYHSPEYAPLKRLRQAHGRADGLLVDGLAEGETLASFRRRREAERQQAEAPDRI